MNSKSPVYCIWLFMYVFIYYIVKVSSVIFSGQFNEATLYLKAIIIMFDDAKIKKYLNLGTRWSNNQLYLHLHFYILCLW